MSNDARSQQRLSLWLRSERAFGLNAVHVPQAVVTDLTQNGSGINHSLNGRLHRHVPGSQGVVAVAGSVVADALALVAGRSEPGVLRRQDDSLVAKRAAHSGGRTAPLQAAESPGVSASLPVLLPGVSSDAPFTTVPLTRAEKIAELVSLDVSQVKGCVKCGLAQTRTNTVFGEGDPDASIFFIGEGPGENEDLQGRPFVGRAGQLLDKMIAGMGFSRQQVFIANIVKCRPPGNRVPATDEVETCTPYLVRQLEIVRPKVIVTLGRPAANYMLRNKLAMGQMRGQWQSYRGIRLMPTFHPSYVLRTYTEQVRATVWGDLKKVLAELGISAPSRS